MSHIPSTFVNTLTAMRAHQPGRVLSVLALLAALCPRADAAQCMFRGTTSDARVVGNGAQFTPHPAPILRQDCERLRVVVGTVQVFSETPDGRIVPRRVNAASPLLERLLADARSTGAGGVWRELDIVLRADEARRGGSSRGAGLVDYPAGALPTGLLMEPDMDLRLPLPATVDDRLQSFALVIDGRLQHEQRGPAAELVLPAALLKAGRRVQWTLRYADVETTGELLVTTAQAVAEAFRDEPGADPTALPLRQAQALMAAGYGWDARSRLAALVTAP
jgi:hypothetical protein